MTMIGVGLGLVLPRRANPLLTLTLQPDETTAIDTFNQEASPSNVATTSTSFAINGAAGSRRNAFLKFDLSSLVGKTIQSAILYLHNITTSVANQSFPLHAILAANSGWVEALNWNFADGAGSTVRWAGDVGANGGVDAGCSVAGTDYNATPIGTMNYLANTPADTQHAISLDAVQLAAMVAANYGFVMVRSASGIFSMHSSSASTAAFRPQLVVNYTD